MFVTVKLRDRNSPGGMSGSARRVMRIGSAIVATAPMPSMTNPSGSFHSRCWP